LMKALLAKIGIGGAAAGGTAAMIATTFVLGLPVAVLFMALLSWSNRNKQKKLRKIKDRRETIVIQDIKELDELGLMFDEEGEFALTENLDDLENISEDDIKNQTERLERLRQFLNILISPDVTIDSLSLREAEGDEAISVKYSNGKNRENITVGVFLDNAKKVVKDWRKARSEYVSENAYSKLKISARNNFRYQAEEVVVPAEEAGEVAGEEAGVEDRDSDSSSSSELDSSLEIDAEGKMVFDYLSDESEEPQVQASLPQAAQDGWYNVLENERPVVMNFIRFCPAMAKSLLPAANVRELQFFEPLNKGRGQRLLDMLVSANNDFNERMETNPVPAGESDALLRHMLYHAIWNYFGSNRDESALNTSKADKFLNILAVDIFRKVSPANLERLIDPDTGEIKEGYAQAVAGLMVRIYENENNSNFGDGLTGYVNNKRIKGHYDQVLTDLLTNKNKERGEDALDVVGILYDAVLEGHADDTFGVARDKRADVLRVTKEEIRSYMVHGMAVEYDNETRIVKSALDDLSENGVLHKIVDQETLAGKLDAVRAKSFELAKQAKPEEKFRWTIIGGRIANLWKKGKASKILAVILFIIYGITFIGPVIDIVFPGILRGLVKWSYFKMEKRLGQPPAHAEVYTNESSPQIAHSVDAMIDGAYKNTLYLKYKNWLAKKKETWDGKWLGIGTYLRYLMMIFLPILAVWNFRALLARDIMKDKYKETGKAFDRINEELSTFVAVTQDDINNAEERPLYLIQADKAGAQPEIVSMLWVMQNAMLDKEFLFSRTGKAYSTGLDVSWHRKQYLMNRLAMMRKEETLEYKNDAGKVVNGRNIPDDLPSTRMERMRKELMVMSVLQRSGNNQNLGNNKMGYFAVRGMQGMADPLFYGTEDPYFLPMWEYAVREGIQNLPGQLDIKVTGADLAVIMGMDQELAFRALNVWYSDFDGAYYKVTLDRFAPFIDNIAANNDRQNALIAAMQRTVDPQMDEHIKSGKVKAPAHVKTNWAGVVIGFAVVMALVIGIIALEAALFSTGMVYVPIPMLAYVFTALIGFAGAIRFARFLGINKPRSDYRYKSGEKGTLRHFVISRMKQYGDPIPLMGSSSGILSLYMKHIGWLINPRFWGYRNYLNMFRKIVTPLNIARAGLFIGMLAGVAAVIVFSPYITAFFAGLLAAAPFYFVPGGFLSAFGVALITIIVPAIIGFAAKTLHRAVELGGPRAFFKHEITFDALAKTAMKIVLGAILLVVLALAMSVSALAPALSFISPAIFVVVSAIAMYQVMSVTSKSLWTDRKLTESEREQKLFKEEQANYWKRVFGAALAYNVILAVVLGSHAIMFIGANPIVLGIMIILFLLNAFLSIFSFQSIFTYLNMKQKMATQFDLGNLPAKANPIKRFIHFINPLIKQIFKIYRAIFWLGVVPWAFLSFATSSLFLIPWTVPALVIPVIGTISAFWPVLAIVGAVMIAYLVNGFLMRKMYAWLVRKAAGNDMAAESLMRDKESPVKTLADVEKAFREKGMEIYAESGHIIRVLTLIRNEGYITDEEFDDFKDILENPVERAGEFKRYDTNRKSYTRLFGREALSTQKGLMFLETAVFNKYYLSVEEYFNSIIQGGHLHLVTTEMVQKSFEEFFWFDDTEIHDFTMELHIYPTGSVARPVFFNW
ncbi:MAG: hypothetical protein ABH857_00100, partial [Elusimicrobiota bacterium]